MQTALCNTLTIPHDYKNISGIRKYLSYRAIYLEIIKSIGTTRFRKVETLLIRAAENAYTFREMHTLEQVSDLLMKLSMQNESKDAAKFYRALCLRSRHLFREATALLEGIVDFGTPLYKPRALLALGVNSLEVGDSTSAQKLWIEATLAASFNDSFDPLTVLWAIQNLALIKSLEGDHRGALADLEGMSAVVRSIGKWYPLSFYKWLNSLAIELAEAGRIKEARMASYIASTSPYAFAYPEWCETYEYVDFLGYKTPSSIVGLSRALETGNLIDLEIWIDAHANRLAQKFSYPFDQPALIINLLDWKRRFGKKDNDTYEIINTQNEADLEANSLPSLISTFSFGISEQLLGHSSAAFRELLPTMKKRTQTKKGYLVFISHSTKDRWIAKQMSNLIEEQCSKHNVKTFLDEKDIEGGESIHKSIQANIKNCNEFVILLSKYSIDRPWVLIELGAAWVLGKRIVAIIDKLTPEEMPDIIMQYKGIDINAFDDYVQELVKRTAAKRK